VLRAIVFDFDGVIANSEPLHYLAFHDVLGQSGITFPEKEYYDRYLGYDDVGVFKAVAADRGLSWTIDRIAGLVQFKAAVIERLEQNTSILFPGADAAIRRAAALVPLGIASGALGAEIRRVLDREGLRSYFKVIVAAEDTPVSKPAADPYRRAVALLSEAVGAPLLPAECVAVEDSSWGLQSAKAAGLRTVAVAQTYDRAALEADLVISAIGELDVGMMERLCST
jgi:beta-phosphoglucomutase-like phosphatase (HAD superfamily)